MSNTISGCDGLSLQPKMSSELVSDQCQNINESVTQSTVQLPLDRFNIVHLTTGRLRIRVSENNFHKLELISQYLQQDGVKEVISNQQTGSLVVTFDENKLSLIEILELLEKSGLAAAESTSDKDIFAEWKSVDFWKEQSISLIPMFTGLAVTGGLGISGLTSIPVYMIAADTTRWIIDYLESQTSASETNKDSLQPLEGNQTSNPSSSNTIFRENELTALPAKIAYTVVHKIPRRIRFHVALIAQDRAYARRLERLLKSDAQVTSVRVNDHAASVAIAYQSDDINISHWVGLMESALQINPLTNSIPTREKQPPLQTVSPVNEIIKPLKIKTSSETKISETSSAWATMKPSSLSYSLDFLAKFSFVGQ